MKTFAYLMVSRVIVRSQIFGGNPAFYIVSPAPPYFFCSKSTHVNGVADTIMPPE